MTDGACARTSSRGSTSRIVIIIRIRLFVLKETSGDNLWLKTVQIMKRPRNVDCGKVRRPLKRGKITDGIYGRYVFTFFNMAVHCIFYVKCQNLKTVPLETENLVPIILCCVDSLKVEFNKCQFTLRCASLAVAAEVMKGRCSFCCVGMVSAFIFFVWAEESGMNVWNQDELRQRDKQFSGD